MTKENLDTLLKMNGWKKVKYNFPSSDNNMYYLNGFLAYHRNYYMVVNGQMPLRKAQELFNSVDKSLEIRAEGHGGNIFPETGRNDKVMEYCRESIDSGVSLDKVTEKCEELKQKLLVYEPDKFYVEIYHIDTWVGFSKFSDFIKENDINTEWFD